MVIVAIASTAKLALMRLAFAWIVVVLEFR